MRSKLPTMYDVRQIEPGKIAFKDGGERVLEKITPEELAAITATDPVQFARSLVTLFLEKNRIGYSLLAQILYKEGVADQENGPELLRYYDPSSAQLRNGVPVSIFHNEPAIGAIARGKRAVPAALIVVMARAFGIPHEILFKRGSEPIARSREHLAERRAAKEAAGPGSADERLARIRAAVDDLPLRHAVPNEALLELWSRLKAIE